MTEGEWRREIGAALAFRERKPKEAISRLKRLAARTRRVARQNLGEWHVEQTLDLAAVLAAEAGQHGEAAAALRRIVIHHEQAMAYHGHALASALMAVALELFKVGNRAEAARLGWRALRLLGTFPDPSPLLEKLLPQLRSYEQQRAK